MVFKPLIACRLEENLKERKFPHLFNGYEYLFIILQAFYKAVFSILCLVYYLIYIFFMLHYSIFSLLHKKKIIKKKPKYINHIRLKTTEPLVFMFLLQQLTQLKNLQFLSNSILFA